MQAKTQRFKFVSTKPGLFVTLPKGITTPQGKGCLLFKFVRGEKIGLLDFTVELPMNENDKKLLEFIQNIKGYGKTIKKQLTAEEKAEIEKLKEQKKLAIGYVKSKMLKVLNADMDIDFLKAMALEIGIGIVAPNKKEYGAEKLVEKIKRKLEEIQKEIGE